MVVAASFLYCNITYFLFVIDNYFIGDILRLCKWSTFINLDLAFIIYFCINQLYSMGLIYYVQLPIFDQWKALLSFFQIGHRDHLWPVKSKIFTLWPSTKKKKKRVASCAIKYFFQVFEIQ